MTTMRKLSEQEKAKMNERIIPRYGRQCAVVRGCVVDEKEYHIGVMCPDITCLETKRRIGKLVKELMDAEVVFSDGIKLA